MYFIENLESEYNKDKIEYVKLQYIIKDSDIYHQIMK
jgi:hypothetical protein